MKERSEFHYLSLFVWVSLQVRAAVFRSAPNQPFIRMFCRKDIKRLNTFFKKPLNKPLKKPFFLRVTPFFEMHDWPKKGTKVDPFQIRTMPLGPKLGPSGRGCFRPSLPLLPFFPLFFPPLCAIHQGKNIWSFALLYDGAFAGLKNTSIFLAGHGENIQVMHISRYNQKCNKSAN